MTSSKASKAQQSAAEETANAQRAAEAKVTQAGLTARQQMTEAGQPTEAETTLQKGYTAKTTQPAEELLTGAGPISSAVANRVAERVANPGMDYDVASMEKNIGTPVWASLKARGIAAPPGAEGGGGLGTSQYMKQVIPQLAAGKQAAIETDITRGQQYGQEALTQQNQYTQLLDTLVKALGARQAQAGQAGATAQLGATEQAAPYGVSAAQTNQSEVEKRYAQQAADKAAMGQTLADILGAVLAPATGGASMVAAQGVKAAIPK